MANTNIRDSRCLINSYLVSLKTHVVLSLSPLPDTMYTHIHKLIHTRGSFKVARNPTGMFLVGKWKDIEEPMQTEENMHLKTELGTLVL